MANTLNLGDGNWATKEDSLLGYNSENNNFKPLPFDFSRGSSATRVNKDGLIETVGSGKAKIDYENDTKGVLLLEPSRTNLILTSARGSYGNNPGSEANTISPDGTNNAVIPTPDSSSDRYQYSINSGAYATNTKLAYSWYRKRISTPINTSYVGDLQFNVLVNVTQVGLTTQIQSDVNGFDRFQAIFNITDGSASSLIRAYFGTVVGVGNSSVAYFGHQIEAGSYVTSYIPTEGSAVTRLEDNAVQIPASGIIGQTEGVLYWEGLVPTVNQNSNIASFNYSTASSVSLDRLTNGTIRARVWDGGSAIITIISGSYGDVNLKIALAYKSGDTALYINGTLIGTSSVSFTFNSSLTELNLGVGDEYYAFKQISKVKQSKLYNTRLLNAELQALTS